ncbi:MAG: hypothetical protein QXD43_01625 [Candidatus Aenigmatarchaeota archaeon]
MENDILKEFEDLIDDKVYSKELNIKGHKFLIKVSSFENVSKLTDKDVLEALAHNIESIDGKKYSVEDKVKLLKKLPAPITNYIAEEITKLYQLKDNDFENVKKN